MRGSGTLAKEWTEFKLNPTKNCFQVLWGEKYKYKSQ